MILINNKSGREIPPHSIIALAKSVEGEAQELEVSESGEVVWPAYMVSEAVLYNRNHPEMFAVVGAVPVPKNGRGTATRSWPAPCRIFNEKYKNPPNPNNHPISLPSPKLATDKPYIDYSAKLTPRDTTRSKNGMFTFISGGFSEMSSEDFEFVTPVSRPMALAPDVDSIYSGTVNHNTTPFVSNIESFKEVRANLGGIIQRQLLDENANIVREGLMPQDWSDWMDDNAGWEATLPELGFVTPREGIEVAHSEDGLYLLVLKIHVHPTPYVPPPPTPITSQPWDFEMQVVATDRDLNEIEGVSFPYTLRSNGQGIAVVRIFTQLLLNVKPLAGPFILALRFTSATAFRDVETLGSARSTCGVSGWKIRIGDYIPSDEP